MPPWTGRAELICMSEAFSSSPQPPRAGDSNLSFNGIELGPGVTIAASAIRFQYARSRGPGGQNVNKVNTKAELWVPLEAIQGLSERAASRLRQIAGKHLTAQGEIHIAADSHRTQEQNRNAAMERLRQMIRSAMYEPKARRKTRPSKAARKRRLDSKRRRGNVKTLRRPRAGEE